MKRTTYFICSFLGQLVGFFLGGVVGWAAAGFLAMLINGGPLVDQAGLIMLIVGPIGFLVGGVAGMVLAGHWVKKSSRLDAEPGTLDCGKDGCPQRRWR